MEDIKDNLLRESHPLEPFLPENAKVLMMGTFPPKRNRWAMDFYYPNFQNDMWRIVGLVFYGDKEHFLIPDGKRFDQAMIEVFCRDKGIALSDTAEEAVRLKDNASDKFLEITRPRNITALLEKIPRCHTVVTTGEKAATTFASLAGCAVPGVGGCVETIVGGRKVSFYRMPSSSRAFPMALEKKAAYYAEMFGNAGLV